MRFREQRIAVLTGGSRGIGRESVPQLARKGVTSLLTYNTPVRSRGRTVVPGSFTLLTIEHEQHYLPSESASYRRRQNSNGRFDGPFRCEYVAVSSGGWDL